MGVRVPQDPRVGSAYVKLPGVYHSVTVRGQGTLSRPLEPQRSLVYSITAMLRTVNSQDTGSNPVTSAAARTHGGDLSHVAGF